MATEELNTMIMQMEKIISSQAYDKLQKTSFLVSYQWGYEQIGHVHFATLIHSSILSKLDITSKNNNHFNGGIEHHDCKNGEMNCISG